MLRTFFLLAQPPLLARRGDGASDDVRGSTYVKGTNSLVARAFLKF